MDTDLARHLQESPAGLPGWTWAVLGFVASALLGMLGWAMRTVRERDVALAYTKAEADEKFMRRDEGACASHQAQCREAHARLQHDMEIHVALPTHPGADRRIAVIEAKTEVLVERLDRIEQKLDAVLDHWRLVADQKD